MTLHVPSLRAALVLLVDAAARLTTAALDRLDAAVCRASNDLSPSEED